MNAPAHRTDDRDGTASESPTAARSRGGRRARGAVLALAALVVAVPLATVALAGGPSSLAGSGSVGVADAQSGPTLTLTNVTVSPGETETTRLALSEAPNGLSGVQVSVAVGDGSVGTIRGATYGDAFALSEDPVVSDDGTEVTLSAADARDDVNPGATNVTLATVEVRGEAAGETAFSVGIEEMTDEDAAPIQPTTEDATLSVQGGDGPTAGGGDGAGADGGTEGGDGGVTTGLGPTGLPLALALLALTGLLARCRG